MYKETFYGTSSFAGTLQYPLSLRSRPHIAARGSGGAL